MFNEEISATELAKTLSDTLNKVKYQGASFNITRGNETIATITPYTNTRSLPASKLISFLAQLPKLSPEDKADFLNDINSIKTSYIHKDIEWD